MRSRRQRMGYGRTNPFAQFTNDLDLLLPPSFPLQKDVEKLVQFGACSWEVLVQEEQPVLS